MDEFREIELAGGEKAIVDADDYERLSKFKWYLHHTGYAARSVKGGTIFMHRMILGLEFGDERNGDHSKNGKLDNRKSMLRICSQNQNRVNRLIHRNNKSGYKGVTWHVKRQQWRANIGYKRRQIHLGIFETAELAHEFYCLAAEMLYGEFANHGI